MNDGLRFIGITIKGHPDANPDQIKQIIYYICWFNK